MNIIETKNLIYDYIIRDENDNIEESRRALDNVCLEVKEGDFVCVLGRNGSGKSTLAKNFNGILLPTAGDVLVLSMNTKDEDRLLDIRKSVGMVFQNPDNQIIANVVEEDVAFGPENIGVPTEEIWQRVNDAIERVGMEAYRIKSPNKLSGGQKQRIAIAGVLAMKPKCIVLDESTAMLDPIGRKEVLATVKELNKKEGITIILITHYMEETIDADKIVIMDGGRIVMEGTPGEVFAASDTVRACGLELPQVTQLAEELGLKKGIITIGELVDELKSRKS